MADCKGNSGLVFVAFDDPLSCFRIGITKQEFSSVGFYYKDSSTGDIQTSVILIDTMRIESPKWLKRVSIKTLSEDPLVSKLALKELRPVYNEDGSINSKETEKRQSCFRQSIAECSRYGNKKPTREIFDQIFGLKVQNPSRGMYSVEYVNRVIEKMGETSKVPSKGGSDPNGSIVLELPSEYGSDAGGKLGLIKSVSSCIAQNEPINPSSANKLIQSYLRENDLFGDLIYVKIPKKNPLDVALARENAIKEYKPLIDEMLAILTNLMLNDQNFFDLITRGLNRDIKDDFSLDSRKKKSFTSLNQVTRNLIDLINKARVDGTLEDKKLCKEINKYNVVKNLSENIYDCDFGKNEKLDEACNSFIISKDKKGCPDVTHVEVASAICNMRDHLNSITESLKKGNTPVVDINELIHWNNKLIEASSVDCCKLKKIAGEKSVKSIIKISSQKGNELKMRLSCEKDIRISTKDPDVSMFSRDELKEILKFVNQVCDGNRSFDRIRRAIIETLN